MNPVIIINSPISTMARRIIGVVLAAFIGFSCTGNIGEPETVHSQDAERHVNFSVKVPSGHNAPQSRSITDKEENYISSIYILSFRVDGSSEKFDYWSEALETESNTNGSTVQNYSALLKVRNHQQRLVLLANIGDDVKQYIEMRNWKNIEKGTMLAGIEEHLYDPDNGWKADSPSDYRALPMWGESTPQTIINTTSDLTGTIPLLRMVASINVQLDQNVSGLTDKFRLTSVRLYNTNTKGSVVPPKDNYDDYTFNGARTILVHTPTIPADIADYSQRHRGPVLYEDFSPPGEYDISMRGAIYLFEAASTNLYLEATCLVVGGIYDSDDHETYYRVDFVDEYGQTLLNIMRNHKYTINIKDVKQSGYNDPEEAFYSKGEDMEISILHWNEIGIDEIWFDEVYYYSVSPRLFEKDGSASTNNRIRVETDYPEWSYKISSNSNPEGSSGTVSWLQVQSHNEGEEYPGNGTVDHIIFDIQSNSINFRTAYIHVTAGRVTMTVTVNQKFIWVAPILSISPSGNIPGIGATRTVTATGGTYHTIELQVRELEGYLIIATGLLINSGTNISTANVSIPNYGNSNYRRVVQFEYKNPLTGSWISFGQQTQLSFN